MFYIWVQLGYACFLQHGICAATCSGDRDGFKQFFLTIEINTVCGFNFASSPNSVTSSIWRERERDTEGSEFEASMGCK